MINLDDCIELGLLTRPHGYKGHLVLKLNNTSFDNIIKMEWVFVMIDGLPVPFFIEEYSERSASALLLKIHDIESDTKARELSNHPVFISKKGLDISPGQLSDFHYIVGYDVLDQQSGYIGKLEAVIDDPNNPLLQIIDKKQEILLPLQKEFILEVNEKEKTLLVKCPDGLFDLN